MTALGSLISTESDRPADEAEASEAEAYERFVKPGDAVETPDGGLWVVNDVAGDDLAVVSAYRDALGLVYADVYEAVATRLPIKFTTKVVDARAVHRE